MCSSGTCQDLKPFESKLIQPKGLQNTHGKFHPAILQEMKISSTLKAVFVKLGPPLVLPRVLRRKVAAGWC